LSVVEPTSRNTLVAYATKSGGTAEDGNGEHSPFTNALLNHLFEPGLDLRLAFGRIRNEVLKNTAGRQEPFVTGSLGAEHLSLVPMPEQARVASDLSGQKVDYELVAQVNSKRAWDVFLVQHPTGTYADLARQQLARLNDQEEATRNRLEQERETAKRRQQDDITARQEAAAEAAEQRISELVGELRSKLDSLPGRRGPVIDDARSLLASLDRDRDVRALINRGRSYALIIGNKDYRDPNFSRLESPHEDARSLAKLLTTEYGFATELIVSDGSTKNLVLLDQSARELNSLLDDLEENMTSNDRLLIFYAGHGHLDDRTGKAYWIPVDAHNGRRSEFISADAIVSSLRGIKAHSVLVIADSCFSGALFRSGSAGPDPSEAEFANSLAKDAERSSRVLIASGGIEPVLDGGGSGHSIFMLKLLDALGNPIRPIFSARELHVRRLKPGVSGNVKQVPQYDLLPESGHDAGDFVFVHVQGRGGG
jgi:uncharacterized caspase-like protein